MEDGTESLISKIGSSSCAKVMASKAHNTDCYYCKDTNKLYFTYDDDTDFSGKPLSELINLIEMYLESFDVHYYEPYEG